MSTKWHYFTAGGWKLRSITIKPFFLEHQICEFHEPFLCPKLVLYLIKSKFLYLLYLSDLTIHFSSQQLQLGPVLL